MMTRATKTLRPAQAPFDKITLDLVDRHRRRMRMTTDNGFEFLLDLEKAVMLAHGDGLVLDDGRIIEVLATPEALYEVRANSPIHLLQIAWQLGNRHLQAQIFEDHIRIRQDPVIADMLRGLGGKVQAISAPFTPEGGAYDEPHAHDH